MQLYTQAIIVCNGEIYFTHNKIYGFLIVVVPSENWTLIIFVYFAAVSSK